VECWTQGFAETPISSIPVCPDPPKLSLKSGLAEVNIVHLQSGHAGASATAKMKATRGEKKMINAGQGELKEPSDTDSWGTACLSRPFPAFPDAEMDSGRLNSLAGPPVEAQTLDPEEPGWTSDLGPDKHKAQLMLVSGRIIEGQSICIRMSCNNLYSTLWLGIWPWAWPSRREPAKTLAPGKAPAGHQQAPQGDRSPPGRHPGFYGPGGR
jgi:hypothetical protein